MAQAPTGGDETSAKPDEAGRRIARGALLVTLGILVSRLFGLVRQRAIAHFLGTGEAADALAAAFRVGNVTQNLLGEGTLSATFIPVYAELRGRDPSAASRFARASLGLLLLVVIALSALGAIFAGPLARVLAPGFSGDKLALTVDLLRILFPMTGGLVLSAWAIGVLNAHRRFFLAYAAPVIWNLAQIAALWIAARTAPASYESVARMVAWGAVAGALLQLMLLVPSAQRLQTVRGIGFDRRTEGVAEAARRLPAALLGRGVIQLSGLVDMLLVSFLGAGANATFNYAQTIYLLPMSLLGTGEAAASLPELASRSTEIRAAGISKLVEGTMKRVVLLGLTAALVLGVLGSELITLLLQSGKFDRASTEAVTVVLAVYAIALPANALSRVMSTVCFAMGDTGRPARFAIVRVVVSTALSVLLMQRFGVAGVVAGAVVAAYVELALLTRCVYALSGSPWPPAAVLVRAAAVAVVAPIVGVGLRHLLPASFASSVLGAFVILAVAGSAFLVAAFASGLLAVPARFRKRRP